MKRSTMLMSVLGLALACSAAMAEGPRQIGDVRRVVTRLDEQGKATVMVDARVPLVASRAPVGVGEIWVTEQSPAELSPNEDRAHVKVGIQPPRGGTIFRIVEIPPTAPEVAKMDLNTMMKVVGADAPAKGLPPRHPMMHRTRSLDYAIVLSGEIDMLLDEGEVHLKAGDVLVQQATNHAWVNRGKENCRIAFILIDSQAP
jgi:mannose-6-phosphate isomerase-like protein (cupin superfamily)